MFRDTPTLALVELKLERCSRIGTRACFLLVAGAIVLPLAASNGQNPSTTGAVQYQNVPPTSVVTGELESDTQIYLFPERLGFTVAQPFNVDISQPGTVSGPVPNFSETPIPAGQVINIYYLHFDKVGDTDTLFNLFGSATFNEEILGLIVRSDRLLASNGVLGNPATIYPTGDLQGIEFDDGGSTLNLSADRRTLSVDLFVGGAADNIRIITAVPEPACGMLAVLGGLILLSRTSGAVTKKASLDYSYISRRWPIR